MIPRVPMELAGLPPHIEASLKMAVPKCDCGLAATCTGWFVSVTGGDYEINNALLLCAQCAEDLAAIDPGVTIRPLRPAQARKWEVLA